MKNSKKLIGAVAALAISAALATGTTYAWFTSSTQVAVESFTAKVTTGSGSLQVAAVAKDETIVNYNDFKNTLTATDIYNAICGYGGTNGSSVSGKTTSDVFTKIGDGLNALTFAKSKATTTTSGKTGYDYTVDSSSFSLYDLSSSDQDLTAASSGYISFDLIFRTSTTNAKLSLNSNSTVDESGDAPANKVSAWKEIDDAEYGGTDVTSGSALTVRANNAVRVAFVASTSNVQTGTSDIKAVTPTATSTKVWAPHEYYTDGTRATSSSETTSGKVVNSEKGGYYLSNLASDYNSYVGNTVGVVNTPAVTPPAWIITNGEATSGDSTTDLGTFGASLLTSDSSNTYDASATGYTYLRTTVYIWIEGTDGDCFDSILQDSLAVTLGFSVSSS